MRHSKIAPSNKLEEEKKKFSKSQLQIIYQNLYRIEPTKWCSIGCDFCLADSPHGVSDIIPKPVLEQIAEEYAEIVFHSQKPSRGGCLELYHANEPLDYEYDGFDYFDIRKIFADKGFAITTSTAIPAGKEEIAIANLEYIDQISISHMNRERLTPYFERLGIAVYLDLGNYYISKGISLPKDPFEYAIRVEGTVEEKLEELRKEHPSLPKKARFYDIRRDTNKPRYEVQQEETLFLFCGDSDQLSPKVSDRDYLTVIPIGRAFDEVAYKRCAPWGWYDGVKITPEGFFNVIGTKPTHENKTGEIIEKISADDFKVVYMKEYPYIGVSRAMEDHYICI